MSQAQGLTSALQAAARQETVLDVGTQRVARVYAEALLRAADKQKQTEQVQEELTELVTSVFQADRHLEPFLVSGAVSKHAKTEVIQKVFGGRASEIFVDFLLVLNQHERLELLRAIASAYAELMDEAAGRIRVQVASAVALPEEQRERLRQELRQLLRKEPVLELHTDPDLLGGLVVRVGDWLYDYSVRSQLADIRNQIISSSSYEIQSRRDRFCSRNGD